MTVLSWHRLCYCNVQVDLDPIINRGNLKVRTLLHLSRELSTLGLVKVTKTENGRAWLGKHIIMRQSTAGPLDGPNFATFVTQFYMIMNTSLRFWVIL